MKKIGCIALFTFSILLLSSFSIVHAASTITIKQQPTLQMTRQSGQVTFSVKAKGQNLSYQWYVSKDKKKSWAKVSGADKQEHKVIAFKKHHGWYYRCVVSNSTTQKTSNAAMISVTDRNFHYGYELPQSSLRGLYYPKSVDGFCYISSYDGSYRSLIMRAAEEINSKIGKLFIYTDDQHIADIVVMDYTHGKAKKNMYTKEGSIELLNSPAASTWSAVAISDDHTAQHYLIALNHKYLDHEDDEMVTWTIMHEFGHCIGLPHSTSSKDLMYRISRNGMSNNDIKNFKAQREKIKALIEQIN